MAALDGTIIRIRACCRIECEIGYPAFHVYHDEHCPVPNDPSPEGHYRRAEVTMMIRDKLERRGIRTVMMMDTCGTDPILLMI